MSTRESASSVKRVKGQEQMATIGVDPHKQTHTAAAVNPLGVEVGT